MSTAVGARNLLAIEGYSDLLLGGGGFGYSRYGYGGGIGIGGLLLLVLILYLVFGHGRVLNRLEP